MPVLNLKQMNAPDAWRAYIELEFSRRESRTAIVRRRHYGPLRVQSAFYPERDVAHVYLLHPPGGVVGGDQLDINIHLDHEAHALITTPASAKFYRSDEIIAQQQQTLRIDNDAILEWLPQDTILFSDSHVKMNTRVELARNARFIGWDILCLGRPASGEAYDRGHCRQQFELWREGEPLLIERANYAAQNRFLNQAWGMQQKTVVATMLATAADTNVLNTARSIELCSDSGMLSCTLINDVLICRLLCQEAETARNSFTRIWQAVRPLLLGREASVPRIWNT